MLWRTSFLVLAAVALALVAATSFAVADDPPVDDPPVATQPPAADVEPPAQEEPKGADDLLPLAPSRPHWFNFIWRTGFGAAGADVRIKYRHAPEGEPDTFEAQGGGSIDLHMPSAWFYPTAGRQFMVTAGMGYGSAKGTFSTEEDDAEFLDGKQFWRGYWTFPVGVGYRWLLGAEDRVSLNLLGEIHWLFTSLYMEGAKEGVDLNGGGAGIVFGAHYRYRNGFLLGGLLELRGYGTAKRDTKLVGELVDVNFNGNMALISIMLGYEPQSR